jgi:hypothetical protein
MRLIPILTGAVLAAAVVPQTAAALPATYETEFKVSVIAKQTTTWTYGAEPTASTADCEPPVKATGNGKEVVTAKTSRPIRHKAYRVGKQAGFAPVQNRSFEVAVDRTAAMRYEEAAACGSAGGVTNGGPYDCGRRTREADWELRYEKGRMESAEAGQLSPQGPYAQCPVYAAEEVTPAELTSLQARVPARDLFDRELKQHIVIFRETFRFRDGDVAATTTIRWEVTLLRVKPIKRL